MSRTQANLILLVAAAIWGLGNIAHKTVLDHLDALTVVGLTSLIACAFTLPFARFKFGGPRRRSIVSLLRVTAIFLIAQYLQQLAYGSTTVTAASFLISATSVLTPLAAWILLRDKPGFGVWMAAGLTFAGSIFLSGGAPGVAADGDLIAILAAAAFALWTVEISRHAKVFVCDAATTAAQFLGVAAVVLPICAVRGTLEWTPIAAAWPELVALGVFSSAVAYYLQVRAQRHTSASHAAIIVSSESVFAAVAAAAILDERLSPDGFAGATLVVAGVIIVAMGRRISLPSDVMKPAVASMSPAVAIASPLPMAQGSRDDIH